MNINTEDKTELWSRINELEKSDQIIHMTAELLNNSMLEDKEHFLMLIVVKQQEYIDKLEEHNARYRADYYAKKSMEKNNE